VSSIAAYSYLPTLSPPESVTTAAVLPCAAAERAAASVRTPPDLPGRRPSPLPRALGPPSLPGAQAACPRRRPARARPERGRRRRAPPCAAAGRRAPPCAALRRAPVPPPGVGHGRAAPPRRPGSAGGSWCRAAAGHLGPARRPCGRSRGGGRAGSLTSGPRLSAPPLLCFSCYFFSAESSKLHRNL